MGSYETFKEANNFTRSDLRLSMGSGFLELKLVHSYSLMAKTLSVEAFFEKWNRIPKIYASKISYFGDEGRRITNESEDEG